jgi:predicted nucleic acid-binding protein
MERPLLLDTDVLVNFLHGHEQAAAFVTKNADRIVLSAVVVAELYSGVRGDAEEAALGDLIGLFRVVDVTSDIARAGGLLRRDYARSHGVGLADALLAATAASEGAELATLNTRHYPMIRGLRPAYRKAEHG